MLTDLRPVPKPCRHIQRDLGETVALLTDPARLKDAVRALHEKYKLADPLISSSAKESREAGPALLQDSTNR